MYRHRLRPPPRPLAARGAVGVAGTTQALVTKALGSGTVAARGRYTLTASGWNIPTTAADPPTITVQPQAQSVTAPGSATFTVTATGTAPLSYQWQRNNGGGWSNIGGATSSSYTLNPTATSDTGAQFRCIVTNAYGSATSNAATLTVNSGVAGVLSTTFTLASTQSLANAPFAFGHAFKQGDVTTGVSASNTVDWQVSPLTYWPDGSVKHAIVAGRANVINGDTQLTLTAGPATSGTPLTETNLSAALPTTTIAAGGFTWTLNSSIGTADLHRTVCAGPVMSNFIYRKPVSGSADLVLWADVRVYVGGNVEIFPWVENGFATGGASAGADTRAYTLTINAVLRFSQSIAVAHHTRIPLVTGTTFSYWTGTDPQITPKHNRAYLLATKLVPNYGYLSPSDSTLNGLLQSYTPNTLAGINSNMGTAGSSAALIPSEQAFYVTSGGDARAYRSALVFGLSGGSWSTHYRDASTHDPIKFSTFANASLDSGGSPALQDGTGTTNGTAVTSHQPSYGYLPFLITGRWWFWEESAHWAAWNFLKARVNSRRGEVAFESGPFRNASGAAGIIDTRTGAYGNRGAHWSLRTLAQTLALCPTSHGTHADWKTAWEANADFYNATFVDGTFAPGWVSPQGFLGDYSASNNSLYGTPGGNLSWWGAAWMSNFGVQTWGFASDLGLPLTTTAQANHIAVRNHAYKQVVQRAGDGVGSNYNWRRFVVYDYPLGSDNIGVPPNAWYTAEQSYIEYLAAKALASLPATAGLSLKDHSSDADINSGSSSIDYGAFALSALAYAVTHGAPGAKNGWDRVNSASNFSVFSILNSRPEHGIVPITAELPSWVPSPGTFANISLNTINSVSPSNYPKSDLAGPFANWSGAVYVPTFSSLGAYVVHGSGHLSAGSALMCGAWCFDLSIRQWVGRNLPSSPLLESVTNFNVYSESIDAANLGHTYPPHTYDGLVYRPGGSQGYLMRLAMAGGSNVHPIHQFDLSSASAPAQRIVDNTGLTSGGYPASCYDPDRNGMWYCNGSLNGPLQFLSYATNTVTTYPGVGTGIQGNANLVYLPAPYNAILALHADGPYGSYYQGYKLCRIVNNVPQQWQSITVSGSPPSDTRCGGSWSTLLNAVVNYEGAGSYVVRILTPPSSANVQAGTGTWTWSSQTLTGAGGATPAVWRDSNGAVQTNGTWSSMVEVPAARCMIFCSSLSGPVQAWRLTGM